MDKQTLNPLILGFGGGMTSMVPVLMKYGYPKLVLQIEFLYAWIMLILLLIIINMDFKENENILKY